MAWNMPASCLFRKLQNSMKYTLCSKGKNMKSIQLVNLESSHRRMNEAKSYKNKQAFDSAKEELSATLKSIENSDRKTYDMFSMYLNEEF